MTSPPVNEHTTGPGTPPQNAAAGQMPPQQMPPQHVLKRTRVGGVWVASALFAVVLLLLLIFILENGQRVDIGYFGARGHLPLGVALLLAAVSRPAAACGIPAVRATAMLSRMLPSAFR